MQPVNHVQGRAAIYLARNVDTDQIVPARFLSRERRQGYAEVLFHDLRFDATGAERPDFVLNGPPSLRPVILLAGAYFGCGSSREQAVWALQDYGIRCVVAPSFSSIFTSNAAENGLLLVSLPLDTVTGLADALSTGRSELAVELDTQRVIEPNGTSHDFAFDPAAKRNLLAGLSKIDLTLTRGAEIDAFERRYRERFACLT